MVRLWSGQSVVGGRYQENPKVRRVRLWRSVASQRGAASFSAQLCNIDMLCQSTQALKKNLVDAALIAPVAILLHFLDHRSFVLHVLLQIDRNRSPHPRIVVGRSLVVLKVDRDSRLFVDLLFRLGCQFLGIGEYSLASLPSSSSNASFA